MGVKCLLLYKPAHSGAPTTGDVEQLTGALQRLCAVQQSRQAERQLEARCSRLSQAPVRIWCLEGITCVLAASSGLCSLYSSALTTQHFCIQPNNTHAGARLVGGGAAAAASGLLGVAAAPGSGGPRVHLQPVSRRCAAAAASAAAGPSLAPASFPAFLPESPS